MTSADTRTSPRKLVRAAIVRAGVPLLTMGGIGLALPSQDEVADGRSTLAVGVIVAAVAGASVLYEIDAWPLSRRTAAHVGAMVATVLPALAASGWFDVASPRGIAAMLAAFFATGLILWATVYGAITLLNRRRGRGDAP